MLKHPASEDLRFSSYVNYDEKKMKPYSVSYLDENGNERTARFLHYQPAFNFAKGYVGNLPKNRLTVVKDSYEELIVKGLNKAQYYNDTKTDGRNETSFTGYGKSVEDKAVEQFTKLTPEEEIETITRNLNAFLQEKNKRYGNSALEPLNIFTGKTKVGSRLDDKLARVKNSPELRKNDICDLIGYLIHVCRENGFTDFKDQID